MDQSQTLRNPASIILGYRDGPMHLIEKRVGRVKIHCSLFGTVQEYCTVNTTIEQERGTYTMH